MKSRDFAYWLMGYFEILDKSDNDEDFSLSVDQSKCIRNHLNLVFKHEIDPSMGDEKHQEELNQIHEGNSHLFGNDLTMRC